jgi:hypothetical protein
MKQQENKETKYPITPRPLIQQDPINVFEHKLWSLKNVKIHDNDSSMYGKNLIMTDESNNPQRVRKRESKK